MNCRDTSSAVDVKMICVRPSSVSHAPAWESVLARQKSPANTFHR
jgi:hypothetical protein